MSMDVPHAAIRIGIILAIVGSVLVVFFLHRGTIARWWHNHSRDVPLEQEYIALKDKIKDASLLRGRIVEFYALVGGGIALSILICVFFPWYMPIFTELADIFRWIMICTGFGFAAVGAAGAWAFRRKALKALISLRFLTGFAVMWMLVYFVSYTIWPLYLTRYAYDVAGAGLLSVVFPGSETFVDFPSYWIWWQGEYHGFNISVGIVHPVIFGAFVGFGLFIPGQSVASKIKKGLLFYLIDHVVYIITMLIQQIIHIEAKIDFSYLHSGPATYAINIIVGVAWRVTAFKILYPDVMVLLGSAVRGALKTEPVHAVFPNHDEDRIKQQFIADGGRELGGHEQFKQINQRWGIAIKIGTEHELHVRAHGHGSGHFSLSAHYEYGRDTGKHLITGGDYKEGKRILLDFLARKGFEMPSE
jgi:hypothetical protein